MNGCALAGFKAEALTSAGCDSRPPRLMCPSLGARVCSIKNSKEYYCDTGQHWKYATGNELSPEIYIGAA